MAVGVRERIIAAAGIPLPMTPFGRSAKRAAKKTRAENIFLRHLRRLLSATTTLRFADNIRELKSVAAREP